MRLIITVVLLAFASTFVSAQAGSSAFKQRGDSTKMKKLAKDLPAKRAKLYRAQQDKLGGSTLDMVDGLDAISNALLEDAVKLTSFMTGSPADSARRQINADLEGIGRYIWFSRMKRGWGGSLTQIEVSAARLEHLENLISYHVTELYGGSEDVLNDWYEAWFKDQLQN